jgi:uncharacterized caspase-like protein
MIEGKMLQIVSALLVVCSITLASLTAIAETRVALVIGNSGYQNTTPLANPLNDAREMVVALKGAGFVVVEALDADKRKIDGALRTFTDKLATADVALFFYAGHGLQVGSQNYLVPTDAKLERERDLEFEAVSLDFVLRQMEIEREGKTTIVFLDACRDNPLARSLGRSMGARSTAIGRGLAPASTGLGTFIAYSTQPGNIALDGEGRNSPFTAALVKHMSAKGHNLPATMIDVRKDVVAATNGKQVPWDHSALTGDFFFTPGTATPTPGTVQAAPVGTSADVAALQARLAKLEDEASKRTAAPPQAPILHPEILKLAELRARAANLDELTKELQRKLLTSRMLEGQAANPVEKDKLIRDSINIQSEWTRRGLDLKKLKAEIASIEGSLPPQPAAAPIATTAPPVTTKPGVSKDAPNFELADNVGLVGAQIRSFKATSPTACRDACDRETTCTGFQHGRKLPVMGTCELYSRIDTRREDTSWRSGVRK